jgi:hypothetical protein
MRCVITRPHDLMTGDVQWTAEQRGMWGWLVPAGDVLVLGGWRRYTPVVALDVMTGSNAGSSTSVRTSAGHRDDDSGRPG